jgi:hypothetical protein
MNLREITTAPADESGGVSDVAARRSDLPVGR